LVVSLADAGEIDRGRAVLDAWPAGDDPRRDRLRARFVLDYDRKPEEAAEALGRVVARIPHDWRSHYHRARALRAVGRIDDANRAADMARRLRERLDPARLAARLVEDLREPVRSPALRDLAELCRELGLSRLAEEWERLAARRGSNPT
jgi:hypothetical protein